MTKTIKSFTSTQRYFATIDDETGLMTDCRCPDHAIYCPNRKDGCKHMREFNTEVRKAEVFNALRQQYDSRLNGQADTRRCNYEMSLGI